MQTGNVTLDEILLGMSIETNSVIRVKIEGRSMWPLIGTGTMLGIRPLNGNIKKGDIILFRSNGRLITHRVIGIFKKKIDEENRIFLTKGDALTAFDPEVSQKDIIGRAVFIENEGKRTYIDSNIWRFINFAMACYSRICGTIAGKTMKRKGMFASRHTAFIVAINILFPACIYILIWRKMHGNP